jgi:DNA-binding MarR family transcriptional regulator
LINDAAPPATEAAEHVSLHGRLETLLHMLEVSGALFYRRQLGMAELPRRLLTLIGGYGGLTSVELVALTGTEKAQISRSVKALWERGLVERARLRAPILLSEAGVLEFDRIMKAARTRNRRLVRGIAAAELAAFRAMTTRLVERAAMLLVEERTRSEDADAHEIAEPPPIPERVRSPGPARPLAQMVAPPLITLASYIERSATLACRRETGLTGFGGRVLGQIGAAPPITLAGLIAAVGHDKSQVGRAVRRLEEAGLVARDRGNGTIRLSPTAEGIGLHARISAEAMRRDAFLLAPLSAEERDRYAAVLDLLTTNASTVLDEERRREK